MSPSRLRKRIARALMVSWRDQPTRYDIEALQQNTHRVGVVIGVRWALLLVLVTYSVAGGLAYATRMSVLELSSRMTIPALALGFVVLYNTFYQLNYRRLGNIAVWNNLQLALDAVVVTVLVYYSGGAHSWFWSMYSLFILEAAFILPRNRDAWTLAGVCASLLGGVIWLEFFGLLPHVTIPFASGEYYRDGVYISVRYLWQVAVLAGTAAIATKLAGEQRAQEASRQSLVLLDETTGLYSRGYFLRAFGAELRRAQRDARPLHVLLVDIDHFGEFNRRFGIDHGDRLLSGIARSVTECLAETGDALVSTNLAARFGGEEFVIMLAEDVNAAGTPGAADAARLAECIRVAVEGLQVDGAGVTVSVGVASSPDDGITVDSLLDAADSALSLAIEEGGDRIRVAERAAEADDELIDLDSLPSKAEL